MLKPTPSKPGLFSVACKRLTALRGIAVSASIALVFTVLYLVSVTPQVANAATNNTLNFQARLETASGAIVPDGNYDVEFKLYNVSSGGSAEWTEDYTYNSGAGATDARIHVANGYLTVNLGSITAFPNTINWDQQQWLTMNIGGTVNSGPITWDGEMSPRLALTAVPYAFRAGTLVTGNGTNSSTLTLIQPASTTQIFQVPDQGAGGTYNLLTGGSVVGAIAGVVLQSSSPGTVQTGHFNISGTGLLSTLDATGSSLSIGTANASTLTFGKSSANTATTINGTVLVKPTTGNNSTTAFQIQNAAGNPVFNLDSTPADIVTNGSFESSTTGWALKGGASMTNNGPGEYGNKSLDVTTGTANGDGVKYNVSLTNGHLYVLTFYVQLHAINGSTTSGQTWSSLNFGYAQDGATEDAAGLSVTNQSVTTATNGQWYRETLRFTPSAVSGTPYLYIKQSSTVTTSREFYIDGVQLEDVNNFGNSTGSFAPYSEGNINISGKITSPLTIAAGSTTAALQVLDNTYGSVFTVDARQSRVGIGNGTPSSKFMVQSGATDTSTNFSVIKGTATILDATDGGSNNLSLLSLENTASGLTGGTANGEALQVNNVGYVTLQGYSLSAAAGAGANAGTSFSLQGATGQAAGGAANLGGNGATLVLAGGTGGASTGTAANSNGGTIYLEGGTAGTGGSGAAGTGGSVVVKSLTNTTTAFQVQSSGSSPVLNVDTSNGYVGIGTASPSRALDVAVNNTQVAAPMGLLEQAGTGDSSMEFKDPNNSIYVGQDADGSDAFVISSSTAASHARAGAPYDLGYNSITDSFNDSGNSGLIASMPFTTTLGGTTNQITVDFSSGSGDNFAVAIYADSGSNYPGTLLASSPSTAITGTAGGNNWDTATLSTTVTLNPSTKYWLAYETQNGSANYWLDTTKGDTCWQTISGSFGSWTPVNTTSCDQGNSVNNTYGIYALVNPVGSSHSITDAFSNPLMTMTQSGFTTFEGMSNSTSAFQVVNSSASAVLDVDTNNGRVGIGTGTPSSLFDLETNTSTVTAPQVTLNQSGAGDASIAIQTTAQPWYLGVSSANSSNFTITSANADKTSSNFGDTTAETNPDNSGPGYQLCSEYTSGGSGSETVSSMSVYIGSAADVAPNNQFAVAIYTNSSGVPGTLIAHSNAAIVAGFSWNTVTINATITGGTHYWLCYQKNASTGSLSEITRILSGTGAYNTTGGLSFGAWGSSFPAASTDFDGYAMYATYSSTSGSYNTFGTNLMSISSIGQTTLQNSTNSTNAFQVNNSAASTLLDVDTTNSRVGIGTSAPSTALQVAVNNTTTNNLPLSLQQTGSGNSGIQYTTTNGSIYEGEDTDGTFRISSSTAASSNSSILGYNTIGTLNDNSNLGSLDSSQFVATSSGKITTLNAYVYTVGASPTNHGEMAIYSDSGGSAHTLLANSASIVLTANSWNSFSIPSTSVTAGTNYWLVFEADSNTTGYANTTANSQYPTLAMTHTYSSALPTTWATTTSFYGNEASMYASILSSSSGTDSLSSGGNNIATLGKTSGAAVDTGDGSFINCSQFTPSVSGTTNYMTVSLGTTSPSASFSFGIYTGTSSVPQTEVASSGTGTLTTVQGLESLPISATLTAGTLYWLCVNNNDASGPTSDYTYNPSDGVPGWFISRTFSLGWPASMGSGTTASGSIDISVNYTITSNSNGLLKMTNTGQTTLQNVSNSINAFQIQDSSGGTALNVDTADDFVGIGTATPHAQLEVSGDVYLGTQVLTANDQADVCLFGNNTCGAAQSGAFYNKLVLFGGSSQTRALQLYQAASGNAYINSTFSSLNLTTSSNNASVNITPNGSGNIVMTTGSSSSGTKVSTTTNSATAFVVQNASSASIFTVDTSTDTITIGDGSGTVKLQGTVNVNGTDGNTYDVGHLVVTGPSSSQATTSSYVTISGLSTSVGAGTYLIDANVTGATGGGSTPVYFEVTGPATSVVSGFSQITAEGNGVTTSLHQHSSLPTSWPTPPSIAASTNFNYSTQLYVTFSASGTVTVKIKNNGTNNWSALSNGWLRITPVY